MSLGQIRDQTPFLESKFVMIPRSFHKSTYLQELPLSLLLALPTLAIHDIYRQIPPSQLYHAACRSLRILVRAIWQRRELLLYRAKAKPL